MRPRRRRRLATSAAAAALTVGTLVARLVRARRSTRREHVDLYFRDGSMVRLDDRSSDAERMLATGRDLLDGSR